MTPEQLATALDEHLPRMAFLQYGQFYTDDPGFDVEAYYLRVATEILLSLPPDLDLTRLRERNAALVAALREIAAIHQLEPDGGMGWDPENDNHYGSMEPVCRTCGTPDEYAVPYPCDTVKVARALLAEPAS